MEGAPRPAVPGGGLTRRAVLASGLLALIVGGAFGVLVVAVSRERTSARLARHSVGVLAAAERLERLVLELETGQRGFTITGDRRYLQPWTAARSDLPDAEADLMRLTVVPAHHAAAGRIATGVNEYLREYSEPLVAEARRGARSYRHPRAALEAKRNVDALRRRFDHFIATEQTFVAGRERRVVSDAQTAETAAVIGLAGSLLLILAFATFLARSIVLPVRRAAEMARRLAGGDLATRMPDTGPGEIGVLGRAFNTMGASLERNRDELRHLADEQAALRRVATLVARGVAAEELLAAVVAEVDRVLGASSTRLARYEPDDTVVIVESSQPGGPLAVGARWPTDGDHIAGRVHRTGRTARRDATEEVTGELAGQLREMGVRSAVGAPIVVADRLWGTMVAYWTDHDPPADVEARMAQFTDLVATAIANAEGRADLMASRARVVATADETRRRIERDLHDGAQQRLVHTVIALKLARRDLVGAPGPARDLVDEALEHAELATAALRELVHGILPASLGRDGLRAAVEALAAREPLPVSVAVTGERLPRGLEATAYFIVAEALTNVVKHAEAASAEVRADVQRGVLELEVRDDGRGGAEADGGSGLIGLYDRAAAVDGELTVDSPAGGGTVVRARLPVHSG